MLLLARDDQPAVGTLRCVPVVLVLIVLDAHRLVHLAPAGARGRTPVIHGCPLPYQGRSAPSRPTPSPSPLRPPHTGNTHPAGVDRCSPGHSAHTGSSGGRARRRDRILRAGRRFRANPRSYRSIAGSVRSFYVDSSYRYALGCPLWACPALGWASTRARFSYLSRAGQASRGCYAMPPRYVVPRPRRRSRKTRSPTGRPPAVLPLRDSRVP